MHSNLSLKAHLAELHLRIQSLSAKHNGSFDDIKRLLAPDVHVQADVRPRGKSNDVYTIIHYKNLQLNFEFTTDGRTFNVYPGYLTYNGTKIDFTYLSTRCSLTTPLDLESETKLARIIVKLIEVY